MLTFPIALALAPRPASAGQAQSSPAVAELTSAAVGADQQQPPSNLPTSVRQAEADVKQTVRRFRIGVEGGVGLDPELIMFGAHGSFGPVFSRYLEFRPGVEFGVGEVTTSFGINLDVLYTLPGATSGSTWTAYVGAGPNFAVSHRGFDSGDVNSNDRNRFDFSDTDFDGGLNFIAGARHRNGMFLEMKATAYGVSNVKLLVGYNF
jgi:hypothetical protein